MITLKTDERELHTILAALRLYQDLGQDSRGCRSEWIDELATNGGAVPALDATEVDQLCERLNTT